MANIGFIGLGHMGGPMVANLCKEDYQVKVYDVVPDAVKEAVANGAQAANNIAAVVTDVDVVITMLPAGSHVREVYLSESGVLANAATTTLLIDSSTIDILSARELHSISKKRGFTMVDAPVSGGTAGAAAGTLTFMVGGSEVAFSQAKTYLSAMGKNVFHAGKAGSGQAVKMCNNMILGVQMVAVSEAFNLAEKLELAPEVLYEICSTATANCWALHTNCPVPGPVPTSPANRDYQAGFTSAMMLKDLCLAQEAAQQAGVATPLGGNALALYRMYCESGQEHKDFSGIINLLKGTKTDAE